MDACLGALGFALRCAKLPADSAQTKASFQGAAVSYNFATRSPNAARLIWFMFQYISLTPTQTTFSKLDRSYAAFMKSMSMKREPSPYAWRALYAHKSYISEVGHGGARLSASAMHNVYISKHNKSDKESTKNRHLSNTLSLPRFTQSYMCQFRFLC